MATKTSGASKSGAKGARPTPGGAATPGTAPRAQPPIRWPRPDAPTIIAVLLWVVGLVIALAVPAAIVPPGSRDADPRDVWTAFAVSVVGAAIVLFSMGSVYKRRNEPSALILGLVPAFAVVTGGVIFATTMLSRA